MVGFSPPYDPSPCVGLTKATDVAKFSRMQMCESFLVLFFKKEQERKHFFFEKKKQKTFDSF
jgi:hypothetical protein